MSLRILLHPPHLNLKDKKYLNNTIAENWISTAGPNIKLFEKSIKYDHALLLSLLMDIF